MTDPLDEPSETPGVLAGRQVAFTGRLAAMSRREAFRLVRRAGGEPTSGLTRRTALLVVGMRGWPVLPDGSVSLKLQHAERLRSKGGRVEIVSEKGFLERLGLLPAPPPEPATCTVERACRLLGLPEETVRRCEQFGLVRLRGGALAFQDLVSLRQIAALLQEGMTPAAVASALSRLARVLPEFAHPLSQVRLIADAGALVAELRGARMDAAGQLLLDFAGEARRAAPSLRLEHPAGPGEAARLLEEGLDREAEGNFAAAAEAYRRAVELFPSFAEGHYNLANMALRRDDLATAERHYREAARHDPGLAAAWYNLGHVLAESGRFEEAAEALQRAARLLPSWPDPRFNLALCFEELGRRSEAAIHWRAYLKLDPKGEWAEMARAHLRRAGLKVVEERKTKGNLADQI